MPELLAAALPFGHSTWPSLGDNSPPRARRTLPQSSDDTSLGGYLGNSAAYLANSLGRGMLFGFLWVCEAVSSSVGKSSFSRIFNHSSVF